MGVIGEVYDEDSWSVHIQPNGPGTTTRYLGCHDVGDLTIAGPTVEHRHRIDPNGPGRILYHVSKSPPGMPTGSISTPLRRTADWLERLRGCPATVYVLEGKCNSRKMILNYERGMAYVYSDITSRGIAGLLKGHSLAAGTTPANTVQTFNMTPREVVDFFKLNQQRLATTEAEALMSIWAYGSERCAPFCGSPETECDNLVAVAQSAAGPATANVIYSVDGGTTWTATAADPFAADEHIASVVAFPVGDGLTKRWVVARGVTDAGNPAEIAWSDDLGATWNAVNVGATNGEFVNFSRGLWAIDYRHIWCVTDQGAIYFSEDAGLTWTEQVTTNTNALWAVKFCDTRYGIAVGAANTIMTTSDGGEHWFTLVGPAAQAAVIARACDIIDNKQVAVGYADGEVWTTKDLAVGMVSGDWAQQALDLPAGMTSITLINDIMYDRRGGFVSDHFGAIAVRATDGADGFGAILRTFNGGEDWETFVSVALDVGAIGYSAVWTCDPNHIFAVGDIETTAYITELVQGGPIED